eukprot:CFRG4404T1
MVEPRPPVSRSDGDVTEERPGEQSGVQWKNVLLQTLAMVMFYNLLFGPRAAPQTVRDAAYGSPNVDEVVQVAPTDNKDVFFNPVFANGVKMSVKVYINESPEFEIPYPFKHSDKDKIPDSTAALERPIWEENVTIGNYSQHPDEDPAFGISYSLPISDHVKNNGTLYVHVLCSGNGKLNSHDSGNDKENAEKVFIQSHPLTIYKEVVAVSAKRRLLFSDEKDDDAAIVDKQTSTTHPDGTIIAYWHPNVTINLVYDIGKITPRQLPGISREFVNFNREDGTYEPVVYFNDFWNLQEGQYPVNSTLNSVDIHLQVYPIGLFKWNFFISMKEQMRQQAAWGGSVAGESDMMKRLLTDTNPILLVITMIVTVLHTVFDMLAFKNEIQFWKNRKDMEGLSIRSIFTNLAFQTIIFLYLLDNDTSAMILFSTGIGILIESWKITKASDVVVDYNDKWFNLIPSIHFNDKSSYSLSQTKQYDDEAYRILGKLLGPIIVCYSMYSLYYNEYKSVYSWVISTLVGAIYTFGFIAMTPQLFINYKMKSVANMPWRMMTYKALNTFIDDLFAFIITMPMLHRLACLRDDVIFFIYLYQKWIYPVDPNRRNEYEGGDAAGLKDAQTKVPSDCDDKALQSTNDENKKRE